MRNREIGREPQSRTRYPSPPTRQLLRCRHPRSAWLPVAVWPETSPAQGSPASRPVARMSSLCRRSQPGRDPGGRNPSPPRLPAPLAPMLAARPWSPLTSLVFQAGLVSVLLHPGSGQRRQRQVAHEVSVPAPAAGPLLHRGCHESRALRGHLCGRPPLSARGAAPTPRTKVFEAPGVCGCRVLCEEGLRASGVTRRWVGWGSPRGSQAAGRPSRRPSGPRPLAQGGRGLRRGPKGGGGGGGPEGGRGSRAPKHHPPSPRSLQQGKSSSTGNLLDKEELALPPPDYGTSSRAFPAQTAGTFKQRPYSVAVPAFSQVSATAGWGGSPKGRPAGTLYRRGALMKARRPLCLPFPPPGRWWRP